ncbi:unnamed protein product [Protopolystoma xenopodis]|uniref:Uncharacterized protein n=1 Tax=Protopolystoma xenopodis TaxID=117903 RepID=A0A448XMI7_9PLAT|nr:unnamed protein product [Protopolystoma xenopodis]
MPRREVVEQSLVELKAVSYGQGELTPGLGLTLGLTPSPADSGLPGTGDLDPPAVSSIGLRGAKKRSHSQSSMQDLFDVTSMTRSSAGSLSYTAGGPDSLRSGLSSEAGSYGHLSAGKTQAPARRPSLAFTRYSLVKLPHFYQPLRLKLV